LLDNGEVGWINRDRVFGQTTEMRRYRHIYGPVRSARLGFSLGLDLVPHKTCCYDCIYCQQGRTTRKTFELAEWVRVDDVVEEMRDFVRQYRGRIDVITLAGSGEPCLNSGFGRVIRAAKDLGVAPVCVLTNGAPFLHRSVRDAAVDADIVIPTLTSARRRTFKALHRPVEGILPEALISAWLEFKRRFRGRFIVEVMVVAGYNDSDEEVEALRGALQTLEPDEVQLNTVRRPPSEEFAKAVGQQRLQQIGRALGVPFSLPKERGRGAARSDEVEAVLGILKRRPCSAAEIAQTLAVPTNHILKILLDLQEQGRVGTKRVEGQVFYSLEDRGDE